MQHFPILEFGTGGSADNGRGWLDVAMQNREGRLLFKRCSDVSGCRSWHVFVRRRTWKEKKHYETRR